MSKNRQTPKTAKAIRCWPCAKRETLLLVSGYSATLRAKIIDRWLELEAQAKAQAPQVPQTMAQALKLAYQQAEQIEAQAAQLEQASPNRCRTVAEPSSNRCRTVCSRAAAL